MSLGSSTWGPKVWLDLRLAGLWIIYSFINYLKCLQSTNKEKKKVSDSLKVCQKFEGMDKKQKKLLPAVESYITCC